MRIAVIGTGISGTLAARLLATQHEVQVYEASDYIGGHTNTVDIEAFGDRYSVDTGFMVFNRRTYPNFCRLIEMLGVHPQDSDMSFSVRCDETGLEYQGSSLNGLFAQRTNLLRPKFLRMLRDIIHFNRQATTCVLADRIDDGATVGDFVRQCGLHAEFVRHYLVPMAAAIWSTSPRQILEFPARFMIGFCYNHGLLQLRDRPQWMTIKGGARTYIDALTRDIRDRIQLSCPVTNVTRSSDHVTVTTAGNGPTRTEVFDQVVFATHADQTLSMLSDATEDEQQVLSAFPYQSNEAILHTDASLLPRRHRAWASWNYAIPRDDQQSVSVTYDLSRLQNHDSPSPILLTLNRTSDIDPSKVLRELRYMHPAYSMDSITAQREHNRISGLRGTHFCGAYWGYGFHEDGVNSALAVARRFGLTLDACTVASTKDESRIVDTAL
jgi:predicted NAD/FAD-binding protein